MSIRPFLEGGFASSNIPGANRARATDVCAWALYGATVASTRLAMHKLLLGHHLKAHEIGDAKGGRDRDVCGVATTSHDNAAHAAMVVTRVYRVPAAIEKDFGPGAEIHGIDIGRNADVAEIAGAIAGGNVHAAAERDGEMGEVAADADAFAHGIAGATGWARVGIAEPDLRVNEIADRLHDPRAPGQFSEPRPGEIGELVAVAIAARKQEQQHVVGKVGDGRRRHIRRRLVRLAGVVNDEAIGEWARVPRVDRGGDENPLAVTDADE